MTKRKSKNLTQQFHGLPAMGIKGQPGAKGQTGLSLYIGFINDFFDYIETEVDSLIYYTLRTDPNNILNHDKAYVNWLNKSPRIRSASFSSPSSLYYIGEFMNANGTYLDAINGMYSLDAYNDDVNTPYQLHKEPGYAINDETEVYDEILGEKVAMGDAIDSYEYINLTDVTYIDSRNNIYTYEKLYDFESIKDPENENDVIGYRPKYKIKIDFQNVSYDYSDLKWAAEWALTEWAESKEQKEELLDKLFYNYTIAKRGEVAEFKNVKGEIRKEPVWLYPEGTTDSIYDTDPMWSLLIKTIRELIPQFNLRTGEPVTNADGSITDTDFFMTDTTTYFASVDPLSISSKYGKMPVVFSTNTSLSLIYKFALESGNDNSWIYDKFFSSVNETNVPAGAYDETTGKNERIYKQLLRENTKAQTIASIVDPEFPIIDLLNTVFYFKQPIKAMPLYTDNNRYLLMNKVEDTDYEFFDREYIDDINGENTVGYTYTAIHPSTLFKKYFENADKKDFYTVINDLYDMDGTNEGKSIMEQIQNHFDSIYDATNDNDLDEELFNKTYDDYVAILQTGEPMMPAANNNQVKWYPGESKKIKIPTTLSKKVNVGDVLYFYLDQAEFNENQTVKYMAVITEDMLGCTLEYLISKAQVNIPFNYTAIYENEVNNRGVIDNTTTITTTLDQSKIANDGYKNFQMKSMENILSSNDTTGLHLISVDYTTQQSLKMSECKFMTLQAISPNNDEDTGNKYRKFNFYEKNSEMHISADNNGGIHDVAGADGFLVNDTNLSCNYELQHIVYDKYLSFREGNFIYDYMEQGNVVTEHALNTDGTEAVIKNLVYTFDREQFFNEKANDSIMEEYIIGYMLVYQGHIIEQNEVNAPSLKISWNPLCVLDQGIHTHTSGTTDIYNNTLPYIISSADLSSIDVYTEIYNKALEAYQEVEGNPTSSNTELRQAEQLLMQAYDNLEQITNNVLQYEYLPYEIIFTCRKMNGFTYYSNPTLINVAIAHTNVGTEDEPAYRYDIDAYYVNVVYPMVLEEDTSESTDFGYIQFNFDGLTVDKSDNIPFEISILQTPEIPLEFTKILINNQVVYTADNVNDNVDGKNIKTNWFEANFEEGFEIIEDEIIEDDDLIDEDIEEPEIDEDTEDTDSDEDEIDSEDETDVDLTWDKIYGGKYVKVAKYSISVNDNIPDIELDGTTYKIDTAAEYMRALSEASIDGNSQLFALLDSRRASVQTSKRSILVQVYYNVIQTDEETGEDVVVEMHENYTITQPGFIDPRQIPEINMQLSSGLDTLEEINSKDNGVLCNQFRTYLDIDIKKFSKEDWGLYGTGNISMDLRIKNYPYNNELIRNYGISYPKKDATVRFVLYDDYMLTKSLLLNDNLNAYKDYTINRSAVVNKMVALEKGTTVNTLSLSNQFKKLLQDTLTDINKNMFNIGEVTAPAYSTLIPQANQYVNEFKYWLPNYYTLNIHKLEGADDAIVNVSEKIYQTANSQALELSGEQIYTYNDNKYIFMNNEVIEANERAVFGSAGLYHDITIDIKNISIESAENDVIRFAIDFEMGNPIPAVLNMQFYVDQLTIHVAEQHVTEPIEDNDEQIDDDIIDDDEIMEIDVDDEDTEIINENVIDFKLTAGDNSLLNKDKIANGAYNYRFKTEPIMAVINPVSLTAAPVENDPNTSISGLVKMTGSIEPLVTTAHFHNNTLYHIVDDLDDSITSSKILQQYFTKWRSFILKPAYFQDNVAELSIKAFHPSSLDIEKFSHTPEYNYLGELLLTPMEEVELDCTYLNFSFDADGYFNPKMRKDKKTFYYNEDELDASQYNQKTNQCPIFANISHNLTLRTEDEIKAIDTWNFEFAAGNKKYGGLNTASTFTGKNNEYGNGYMFLPESYDTKQYEQDKIMSLADLKESQNVVATDVSDTKNIEHSMTNNVDFPASTDVLYRALTYDISWEHPYPHEYNSDIEHAPLISPFDMLLYHILYEEDNREISDTTVPFNFPERYIKHLNALAKFAYGDNYVADSEVNPNVNFITETGLLMMPYNYCYEISPRIAYNYDMLIYNVMMLRRPCVGYDTDDLTEIENYLMQRSYLADNDTPILEHHSRNAYSSALFENDN